MRAVNLIPAEDRRGAGGAAGRSGGGAYAVLGGLAVAVAMASAWVVTGNGLDDKQAQLDRISQQADQAEAQAQSLASYTKFAAVRAKRVQTVSQLAESRFDWAHALHEVARVLPENAWLTNLTATSSPGVSVGSGASGLRGALAVPAIEVAGCTTSQRSVAKMMARMRLIDGVERVSLDNAAKGDTSGGTSTGSAGSGDCRGGHAQFPQFSMVVFFSQAAAPVAAAPGTATTAAAVASTTTPAPTTSAPASGGTTK
ncbi:MAG TPA: PilN domain-containing protein [Baekduia sp.]|nr:PilN domain-containing protein [Baekduia sp.]